MRSLAVLKSDEKLYTKIGISNVNARHALGRLQVPLAHFSAANDAHYDQI